MTSINALHRSAHGVSCRVATRSLLCVALVGLAAGGVLGCRGDRSSKPPRQFFPDMDDQPKVKPQTKSTFFQEFAGGYGEEDWGRAARLPVSGTVPFGRWPVAEPEIMGVDFAERDSFLALNSELHTGKTADGDVIDTIPIDVDTELLSLGRERYEIYCIACHGGTGVGDGTVGVEWVNPVPSYHEARYQKGSGEPSGRDGHIFDVIRNGVANLPGTKPALRMPAYREKVSVEESWAIVAYIRALQATRRGDVNDLPAVDRERLLAGRRDRDAANTQAVAAEGGDR